MEESNWRQKIQAIWIREGDNNTKYFHKFSSFYRMTNSIWEIKDDQGKKVTSFEEIVGAGKKNSPVYLRNPWVVLSLRS